MARRPALIALAFGGTVSVVTSIGLASGSSERQWTTADVVALAGATGIGAAVGLSQSIGAARRRCERRADQAVDVFVGLLVAELDAGTAAPAAWTAAAAAANLTDGLGQAADRSMVRTAWQVAETTGAPISRVIAALRDDRAAARDTARTIEVAVAGPRASGFMLAVLPVLGLGLGFALDAHPLAVLLGSAPGPQLLCAGIACDALGVGWIAALARRATGRPP